MSLYFRAKWVDISKTVKDTFIVSNLVLLMINRKLHMHFRLTYRSMTLDDLELLSVPIFVEFRGIWQILEATTGAKRMKIATVRSCNPHVPCVDLSLGPSYTHCCCALTLALARFSCRSSHRSYQCLVPSNPKSSIKFFSCSDNS